MSFVSDSGKYITPHMSRLLGLIAQSLDERDRLKLQEEYDTAESDSDLAHWVVEHPIKISS